MIIRLGLMDTDERYTSKLADYFNAHQDRTTYLELSRFTKLSEYKAFVNESNRLDILLASASALENPDEIEDQVLVAYFSEEKNLKKYKERPVICKYQKAIDIFRSIQDLASNIHGNGGIYSIKGSGRIILFVGSAGGVGCTTAAIGFATRMARMGREVVYLSYQQNAQPGFYFQETGASMSDVHYAYLEWQRMRDDVGNRERDGEEDKSNLQVKLSSKIATDSLTGVNCYGGFVLPVDALELNSSEICDQIEVLAGKYDDCVIDMDGRIDGNLLAVIRICYWTIVVSDGTQKGNDCATRMLQGLKALYDSGKTDKLSLEMGLLYTRFGSHSEELPSLPNFARVVGKIPRYEGASAQTIVQDLARSNCYSILEPLDRRGE